MADPKWLKEGAAHIWRPYCQHQIAPPPLPVVSAKGSRLHLADGRELVDGIASWWTAAHGYGHPHIAERVQEQLHSLPHVAFGGLAHEAAYTLAARLSEQLPQTLSKVFFVDSGSVAVEVALKMAVQSFYNQGERARRKIVSFQNAYHGDTLATMALCDPVTGMHRAFAGLGIEAIHFPLPVIGDPFEEEFASVADQVAAVIIEPLVQCAGGMVFHDALLLQRLRNVCDEHGVLLIFDEIATGFYRTGSRFALEEAGVAPDIVALGKALTGGVMSLAATVASEKVYESFLSDRADRALQHGPTYMANALACAAAHASLDLFDAPEMSSLPRRLETSMAAAFSAFRERPNVKDVRVKGAVGVVEMMPGTAPHSDDFAALGAFIRPLRLAEADVVYLMPPLVIDDRDLGVLFDAIDGALPR